MCALINIALTDDKPLYIDPSDVTGMQTFPKGELALYNSKGILLHIEAKSWNVDAADIAQKLADNGTPLFDLGLHYISPAAATYITISQTGNNGEIGLCVGVKGIGYIGKDDATQAEVDALIVAVGATKNLAKYLQEEARAWNESAVLYLDPKSVTRIVTNHPGQIDVIFEKSGMIQMNIAETNPFVIAEALPRPLSQETMQEIFQEVARRQKAGEQAKLNIANGLAALHGGLIAVPVPERAIHLSREDIGYVTFRNDDETEKRMLYIRPQETKSNIYPQSVQLSFNTDEERLKAFAALNAATGPKPAQKNQNTPKI